MNVCRQVCLALVIAGAVLAIKTAAAQPEGKTQLPAVAQEAAHEAEGHAEKPNPMAFSPDLAIFTAIVFLILLAILSWFAWPQITAALDERERKIADNIAAAAARHEDAKRLLAEHEAKLAAAAGEVRALMEEARRDAESTRQRIESEGHKAAKDELDRAVREIGRARDAAIKDLAVSSANTAIELARNVIRVNLTPEQNNQLVRKAAAKLAAEPSKN